MVGTNTPEVRSTFSGAISRACGFFTCIASEAVWPLMILKNNFVQRHTIIWLTLFTEKDILGKKKKKLRYNPPVDTDPAWTMALDSMHHDLDIHS